MYVSVLKIETVQAQAALTSSSNHTVREVDLRVVRYTCCKNCHKLARFPLAAEVLFCKQKLLNDLSITHDPQ